MSPGEMQGEMRGLHSLHHFMSWLHKLETGDYHDELAAFKEVTVWRVRPAANVAAMSVNTSLKRHVTHLAH